MANSSTDPLTPAAPSESPRVVPATDKRVYSSSVVASTTFAVVGVALFVIAAVVGTSLLQSPPVVRAPMDSQGKNKAFATKENAGGVDLELRADFPIKADLVGGKEGPGGSRILVEGARIACSFDVGRNAYVGVWMVSADGTVLQLYPSRLDSGNFVRAGQHRVVPSAAEFSIPAEAVASPGQIRVLACEFPWEAPAGKLRGPYTVFQTDEEQRGWLRQLNAMTNLEEKSHGLVAEVVLPFRITPVKSTPR